MLEIADIKTGQDIEYKQASKGHLLAGEDKSQDWSEHRKKASL